MMPKFLDHREEFPHGDQADEFGIVAVGGDFAPERLLQAYQKGIFPWPHQDLPILWFCPDPRFVLEPKNIIIARSLKKILKATTLSIRADTNFLAVMKHCQSIQQARHDATWITDEMIHGYYELHKQGFAHSIEAYDGTQLVGGLYGISLGSIFFGESMFYVQPNASKVCFATLVAHLIDWHFSLIDCQAHTHHLERFGAHAIDRPEFLSHIYANNNVPSKKGPWLLNIAPAQALDFFSLR